MEIGERVRYIRMVSSRTALLDLEGVSGLLAWSFGRAILGKISQAVTKLIRRLVEPASHVAAIHGIIETAIRWL